MISVTSSLVLKEPKMTHPVKAPKKLIEVSLPLDAINAARIPAKATTPADQSDSIVVSFGAAWYQHLLAKDFSAVIRKRIPKNNSFKWLYFHINSPVSAICGRAEIKQIFSATAKEAVTLAKQINLSVDEISSYVGRDNGIGCYRLGTFQPSAKPVPISTLATRLAYYPPQSFFILSKQAKKVIDELSGFNTKSAQPRRAGNS
jgi:predicted transcriptional regulator